MDVSSQGQHVTAIQVVISAWPASLLTQRAGATLVMFPTVFPGQRKVLAGVCDEAPVPTEEMSPLPLELNFLSEWRFHLC
jgi:hypothetical protein